MANKTFAGSLRCAWRGLLWALATERNSLLFTILLGCSIVSCKVLAAPAWCWFAVVVIWAGGLSAEMDNTAIERMVDKFGEGRQDAESGLVKDIGAGAVMPWGMSLVALMAYVAATSERTPVVAWEALRSAVTLVPIMLGGMSSMVVMRWDWWMPHLARPIDAGTVMSDGRRMFGENKTWRGVASMAVCCAAFQVVCDAVMRAEGLEHVSHTASYVPPDTHPVVSSLLIGALIGVMYMLSELPNSYMKRRLGVGAGGSSSEESARRRMLLFMADYLDSSIGGCMVICSWAGLGVSSYFLYLAVSFLMHIAANLVLRRLRVRETM